MVLTIVGLQQIALLRAREQDACLAVLRFPSDRVFAAFPTVAGQRQIWEGAVLAPGDIAFFGPGSIAHRRAPRPCEWGLVSLGLDALSYWSSTVLGRRILPPEGSRIVRPAGSDATRLRYLHSQAADLAETNPHAIEHPEVARSIEQELIVALLDCLAGGAARSDTHQRRRYAGAMMRFEEGIDDDRQSLASPPSRLADWAAGACCRRLSGTSPARYRRLRRRGLRRI